jgi:ABC-type dipeptide/oligopeptide/nickel transport system permease subunit
MTAVSPAAADVAGAGVGRRRTLRIPVTVALAMLVIVAVAAAVVAPVLAPHNPDFLNPLESLRGPSWQHPLGTDKLGRDVFSRVIAGARTACIAPLVLAIGSVVVSVALGLVAGFAGRWVDLAVSRFVDVLYSLPGLVVAIVVVGVTDGGLRMSIAVLLLFGLPMNIRIFRAAVLERVRLPYIEAARTVGISTPRIILTQLLPTLVPLIVTSFFLQYTYGLVAVSSLSFLGLGVPPGAPDWGRMMFENRASLSSNVWATAGPGVVLAALAVSANVVGDWIHHANETAARQR